MTAGGWNAPQWVMLGVDMHEYQDSRRCVVAASQRLSRAELEQKVMPLETLSNYGRRSYRMTVTMDDVVFAFGATYGEAIQRLFNVWAPDGPDARPAIAAPTPELAP